MNVIKQSSLLSKMSKGTQLCRYGGYSCTELHIKTTTITEGHEISQLHIVQRHITLGTQQKYLLNIYTVFIIF